ncbi:MAG: polysaccharide export protein [Rhodobacteraceae bacterium]|nr:polysaccharide export protein [Paracoccaceae bacterium]
MGALYRLLAAICLLPALAACTLPRGAALQSEVLRAENSATAGFEVHHVDRALLGMVAQWPAPDGVAQRQWPSHRPGEAGTIIAAGDTVEITVWESGENSLLAAPSQKESLLQPMRVAANGTIFVPYVGPVRISGMSPDHARETVQEKLAALIPSAQVQLSVAAGPSNSISLVGGVRTPGTYPVDTREITVLDLISRGGGVPESLANPQVRLVRGRNYYAISLERLYANPDLDATLQRGDKVFVETDPRYFLALGAAGHESQIAFNRETVSALDALSLAGGLNDSRANPKGILILRDYGARAGGATGPKESRVVFAIDLTSADGLFSAGRFAVMPKDVVLATESPVTSAQTILGLLGTSLGLASRVDQF